jgi:hypothetical protein
MIVRRITWAAGLAFAVCAGLLLQASSVPATPSGADDPALSAVSQQKINQAYGGQSVKHAGAKPGGKPGNAKWAKATKGSKPIDGLFRIHKGDNNWHLQINPDQFDQQYILALTIGRGIGSKFILSGLTLGESVVRFEKKGEKVLFYRDDVRFIATGDEDLERAVELSYSPSLVHVFKVAAEKKDTVLVDFTDFLLSDYADIGQGWKNALGGAPARFDKKRSTLGRLRGFERNMEMEANLTYAPGNREKAHVITVADSRYIPITIQYSLMDLPEPGFVPRLMDDRVGYFPTTIKDFTRDDQENYYTHFANRWRLEKKDPSARVSEVVKPITFYLENTIPEKWRPYIRQGVELWQPAYEAAGFKNAIIALEQPDDSTWDAADVQNASIRWIASSEPSFGAIGPSRVDPRTGEIFDADILIEAFWIQAFNNSYRRYVGPETVQEALDGITQEELELMTALGGPSRMCQIGQVAFDTGNMMNLAMRFDLNLPPGSPVPDEFIGQTLVELTMHEVGHTLGLRHNFQSSVAVPNDKLGDRNYVMQNGMTGSVMDYAPPYIKGHERSDHLYLTPVIGPYDYWAIRYGYTPTVAESPWEEQDFLGRIAEECMQPGHEYGTDEDTYPANALDPRNHIFDLGSSPIDYGKWRAGYIQSLWSRTDFEKRILAPGTGFQTLRNAMSTLVWQYGRALSVGLNYVGGQQVNRAHYDDPGATAPLRPMPANVQRDALEYLNEKAFGPDAFQVPADMLNNMLGNRNWTWDGGAFRDRIDYPYFTIVLGFQSGILDRLMQPQRMARLREAENRQADPLTVAEMYNELTGAIWGEFGVGSSAAPARQNPAETMEATAGPGTRRDLQRHYVDNLVKWILNPAYAGTDDVRAIARLQLIRIDRACQRALNSNQPDVIEAHLHETRARIERGLEADKIAKG